MTTINCKQFQEICGAVWRDRARVVAGRGLLTGEAALVRAVYWRLSKAGISPVLNVDKRGVEAISAYQIAVNSLLELHACPPFDGAAYLDELLHRYKNDGTQSEAIAL